MFRKTGLAFAFVGALLVGGFAMTSSADAGCGRGYYGGHYGGYGGGYSRAYYGGYGRAYYSGYVPRYNVYYAPRGHHHHHGVSFSFGF